MHNSLLNIQSELEKARERLKGVEETIKKSIGRDINNSQTPRAGFKRTVRHLETSQDGVKEAQRPRFEISVKTRLGESIPWGGVGGGQLAAGHDFRGNRNIRNERFRGGNTDERLPAKKRLGEQTAVTVFSRLSGPPKDDEYEEKETVKITSQVIVQDTPSRKEVLAAQSGDNQCKARNRRMFGALIGHIQKFRQEESRLKEKERKKAEVEKKVEEAALREKEELKKKRQELFSSRRQQQQEIRQLEYKLMRMKQLTEWESTRKHLVNFIQTSANPKIFYLPKHHNAKTKELLEESKQRIVKMMEEKRAEVERSIADHGKRPWKVGNNDSTPFKKHRLHTRLSDGANATNDNEDITSMGRTVEAAELADEDDEEEEDGEMNAAAGDGGDTRAADGGVNSDTEMVHNDDDDEEDEENPALVNDDDSSSKQIVGMREEVVDGDNDNEFTASGTAWSNIGENVAVDGAEEAAAGDEQDHVAGADEVNMEVETRTIQLVQNESLADNGSVSDKENLLDIQPPPDDPPSSAVMGSHVAE